MPLLDIDEICWSSWWLCIKLSVRSSPCGGQVAMTSSTISISFQGEPQHLLWPSAGWNTSCRWSRQEAFKIPYLPTRRRLPFYFSWVSTFYILEAFPVALAYAIFYDVNSVLRPSKDHFSFSWRGYKTSIFWLVLIDIVGRTVAILIKWSAYCIFHAHVPSMPFASSFVIDHGVPIACLPVILSWFQRIIEPISPVHANVSKLSPTSFLKSNIRIE